MGKLRHNRAAWVEHCRAKQLVKAEFNRTDDGMSHGIIPFGAVRHSLEMAASQRARILSQPLLARVAQDRYGSGLLALEITCPYCSHLHFHLLDEADLTERLNCPLEASCGQGAYRVRIEGPVEYAWE